MKLQNEYLREKVVKTKNVVIFLIVLYSLITIPLFFKYWKEISYTITHKDDINWLQDIKDESWSSKKAIMTEKKVIIEKEASEKSEEKKEEISH